MDAVQGSQAGGNTPPTGVAQQTPKISSDFETFLKMLTTQIQNQDPLNPMDSQQFAVQLATFSSVEQQVLTNDLLTSLGDRMAATGMSEMAGWVGMEARAPAAVQFSGTPVTVYSAPAPGADQAVLIVRNQDGSEVQKLPIPTAEGPLEWAGVQDDGTPLADGLYTFEVESFADGASIATGSADAYAKVVEVRSNGGATELILAGGVVIAADLVSALRRPGGP